MTDLRDQFAMAALQGLLANAHLQKEFVKDTKNLMKELEITKPGKISEYLQYHHALISYAFADAMMKERVKDSKKQLDPQQPTHPNQSPSDTKHE